VQVLTGMTSRSRLNIEGQHSPRRPHGGAAGLNDNFWSTYQTGPISDNIYLTVTTDFRSAQRIQSDQPGNACPRSGKGDSGAIESGSIFRFSIQNRLPGIQPDLRCVDLHKVRS